MTHIPNHIKSSTQKYEVLIDTYESSYLKRSSDSLLIISQNIIRFVVDEIKFLIVYDPGYKN